MLLPNEDSDSVPSTLVLIKLYKQLECAVSHFALMGHNNAAVSALVLTKNKLIIGLVVTSLCTIRSTEWAEPGRAVNHSR